ncbi:RNA polymerase sigma factor [Dyadobacter frigoris]|uniref:Sigma-70 family RNA polymerase sigma factor n=1 Tax=Dyadobacter frigoris TaxID=2576211 RepID=A0A4U6CQ03_9BACT|nr:sigma-70 family RNA polymerase sigma factor [Dyadobacter frigoris]TKT86560.1 sigma-70 family RNA polymerase sigma factor [Dyadobacter frigoris]
MRDISTEEDHMLILGICNGNRDAFDVLYRKYWKFVYNAAYKRLSNSDQAKDIAQDIFIQLWGRLNSHTSSLEIENLSSYLYVAVRNSVFNWIEKEKKFVPIADLLLQLDNQKDNADAQMRYNELFSAYEALIENLPKQQQVIFLMRYDLDLSSDEIAKKLAISPKTVRNQLGRAMSKLKAELLMGMLLLIVTASISERFDFLRELMVIDDVRLISLANHE